MSPPVPTIDPSFTATQWFARSRRQVFAELDRATGTLRWHGDPGERILDRPAGTTPIATAADFTALVHEPDVSFFARDWFRIATGRASEFVCRLVPPGGEPRWVHVIAHPFDGEGVGGVSGLAVSDIDEMVRFIETRADVRRSQAIESMAAGVAHEFNNALTPVRGFLQLAIRGLGPEHPQTRDLTTALTSAEKCSGLVAQLQQSGRKALLEIRRVTADAFLGGLLHIARGLAAANPAVRLRTLVKAGLPDLRVDPSRTRQALANLVRNAVEAMPAGGDLDLRASLWLDRGSGAAVPSHIRIDIIDGGAGIPAEDLERVFDPFYTSHNQPPGSGLCLPTAQGLAEQMGGWLEVHSTPGKGTEVRCFLPVWQGVEDNGSSPAPTGRVLVVDDEPYRRRRSAKTLRDAGWRVDEVETFAEAQDLEGTATAHDLIVFQSAAGTAPEAVLPGLREAAPGARFILLGGHASLSGHGVAVLAAPFSPKTLLARVKELMA